MDYATVLFHSELGQTLTRADGAVLNGGSALTLVLLKAGLLEAQADLETDYTPPAVDTLLSGHQKTTYNLDQQVSSVAPDGVPAITPM